jgi:selenium metabolism protein YedF
MKRKKVLVFIDGETIGKGNDELGRILMRSFLYTLKDLETRPWRIIFIYTGVKLAAEGSEYLDILKEIESLGVEILSCGTCLDYFNLKDRLKAGRISNMNEIVSSFIGATNVIKP